MFTKVNTIKFACEQSNRTLKRAVELPMQFCFCLCSAWSWYTLDLELFKPQIKPWVQLKFWQ